MQCSLAYEGSNRFFNDWLAPQQKLNEDDDNNYTSEEGQIFLGASQPLPCLEHKQYLPVPSEQKNQQKKKNDFYIPCRTLDGFKSHNLLAQHFW